MAQLNGHSRKSSKQSVSGEDNKKDLKRMWYHLTHLPRITQYSVVEVLGRLPTYIMHGIPMNIFSTFSKNSKVSASECLEDHEGMFSYW